jgi:hypothetical protein
MAAQSVGIGIGIGAAMMSFPLAHQKHWPHGRRRMAGVDRIMPEE